LKAEAWEVAKLDNETLLEKWEVLKEECRVWGEKLPLKPCVVTHAEVWAWNCCVKNRGSQQRSYLMI
jgi:hypothetical protein